MTFHMELVADIDWKYEFKKQHLKIKFAVTSYDIKLETSLTCKSTDTIKARRRLHYCIVQSVVWQLQCRYKCQHKTIDLDNYIWHNNGIVFNWCCVISKRPAARNVQKQILTNVNNMVKFVNFKMVIHEFSVVADAAGKLPTAVIFPSWAKDVQEIL